MEEKSGLDRIINEYSELNKAEKKAAKYILENPEDVVHSSIKDLANNSGVSNTTIFRLCNRLGFTGFQELKINLAGTIQGNMKNIHEEVKEDDDTYIVMQKILKSNISSMEKTIDINDTELIDEAAEYILDSKRIIFAGMGGSGSIAEDAYHKFIRTGKICNYSADSHWQSMLISLAEPEDVFFAVSNSGRNKELLEMIKHGKLKGLKIISITSDKNSPIARASDVSIISYGKESTFRSEAMESRATALMLIDIIYIKVSMTLKSDVVKNLMDIRKGIANKRTDKE